MAVIGTLGDIVFSVSAKQTLTFDSIKWDIGAKYASHDRHLKKPLLEFLGEELDEISFSVVLSVFLGVNPETQIAKITQYTKKGTALRLIVGGKVYGDNKWVIEKCSKSYERFDKKGNLLHAKCSLTLKEYAKR